MDMISTLPEPILCHILSFLPTKTSVACSVLSKGWKLLWTFVPVLDLNLYRDMPKRPNEQEKERELRFLRTVDKVYSVPREFPVKMILRLSIGINESCEFNNYLHKWIMAGRFDGLDLSISFQFSIPKSPRYRNMVVLNLSSCSKLLLETPALEYPSFQHVATKDSLVAPSSCNSIRADIKCLVQTNDYTKYGYGSSVMKLLNNLSCVEFLKLSLEKMGCPNDRWVAPLPGLVDKFDYSCLYDLPVFDNLACLDLHIPSSDCVLLPHLLQKFHNLKHISIHKIFDVYEDEVCWMEPLQVPICLSSTLSSFYFHGFDGFEVEAELVKYVAEHAKVLKNMALITSSYFKALELRAEATHKLSIYLRGFGARHFQII